MSDICLCTAWQGEIALICLAFGCVAPDPAEMPNEKCQVELLFQMEVSFQMRDGCPQQFSLRGAFLSAPPLPTPFHRQGSSHILSRILIVKGLLKFSSRKGLTVVEKQEKNLLPSVCWGRGLRYLIRPWAGDRITVISLGYARGYAFPSLHSNIGWEPGFRCFIRTWGGPDFRYLIGICAGDCVSVTSFEHWLGARFPLLD